jgi:hypothetical protein
VATTENSVFAAIEDHQRRFYGLQFHPEVAHTPRGKEILTNFVHGVCGCGKGWTMRRYVDQAVDEIRAQVGQEKVILGLSGGVDSSVAAAFAASGNRRSADLHLREQRTAPLARGGGRSGGFWSQLQSEAAVRGCDEALSRPTEEGHGPGAQAKRSSGRPSSRSSRRRLAGPERPSFSLRAHCIPM